MRAIFLAHIILPFIIILINNVCRKVQIKKLLIVQVSPASRYFISHMSLSTSQEPVVILASIYVLPVNVRGDNNNSKSKSKK